MTVSARRLSLNSATVKRLSLGIGVWREQLVGLGVDAASGLIREAGLRISSLCRGGFFTGGSDGWRETLDDNRAAIEEARILGAEGLVLCGGLVPGSRDLARAREISGGRRRHLSRLVGPPCSM
jgi:sugar phosphate isomerase/epimerase